MYKWCILNHKVIFVVPKVLYYVESYKKLPLSVPSVKCLYLVFIKTVKCLMTLVATYGCSDGCVRGMLGPNRDVNPDKLISGDSMTLYCLKLYKCLYTQTCAQTCQEIVFHSMKCDFILWNVRLFVVAHTLSLRRQGQEDLCDYTDSWVYEVSIVNSISIRATYWDQVKKERGGNVLLYMYFIIN